MSVELEESNVTYEQLDELEDEFEDVELELLRQQVELTKDLYAKREKLVADIQNFWPLVFEQSPADIDEYVQQSDSLLLASLKSMTVDRFELPNGDPRSIAIRMDFLDNEYMENKVLEKKLWWRYAKDGWSGLVGEPVKIQWKSAEKDLTGGMLDLACKVWEEDKAAAAEAGDDAKAGEAQETEAKKKLKEMMDETGLGGVSFFAFFGYRGRYISAEEDREARKMEQERRQARKEGKETKDEDDDKEDDEEEGNDEYELEIFPAGDDLAVALAEDLWPGAIKYFIEAQGNECMSDVDFESDEDMSEVDGANPPPKKRKA